MIRTSLHEHLETVCSSILSVEKNIQSVALINNKGRVIEKSSKPMFAEQYPDYFSELFCMHHVLQVSMGRDFDENYGPVNYHVSERRRFTTLSFPVGDIVILVTTSKNISPITLSRKIIEVITKNRT